MWDFKEYDLAPWYIELGWWLIDIGKKDTDYILWADILSELKEEELINRQVKYEYNQWAEYETRNWCTIFSAFTMLSYLKDKQFSIDDIKEVWHKMIEDWKLDPDVWAYLSDAIDYVRKWYNSKYEDKIVSYAVELEDEKLLEKINKKNLIIQVWYKTSSQFFIDSQDTDWVWRVSWKDYPKYWWHAVVMWWPVHWIIDSYFWQKTRNRYLIEYLQDLVNNWVFFKTWYIFLNQ